MDARYMLLTQLESLTQQMSQAEKGVASQKLDERLLERVLPRFDRLLPQQRQKTKMLREEVLSGQPLQSCWSKYSQLEGECRKLFDECLAFIQGALARAGEVDAGMCLHADHLLDDFAYYSDNGWRRFTLLSTQEFYRDTAEIIRMRFPEVSFWGLPVMAHEFGHFLGPELREDQDGSYRYPLQELLKAADETRPANWPLPHAQSWHHLHEHFADLFATYSLGPAFACSFIFLRINPMDAYKTSATHPSHAQRVHSLLWMLEQMDKAVTGSSKPYREMLELLKELWKQNMNTVSLPDELPDVERALLETRLESLLDILKPNTPSRLAFPPKDWLTAQILAEGLDSDDWSPGLPVDGEVTRRTVLNGAWLRRITINKPDQHLVNLIGERALELYRLIPPREL